MLKKLLAGILTLCTMASSAVFAVENDDGEYDIQIKSGAYHIFVDPNGDDGASGTKDDPLATFEGARLKVRGLKAQKAYAKRQIVVNFLPGVYRMGAMIKFDEKDYGCEGGEVIYRGYEPDTVEFRQSVKMDISKMTKVTNEDILARLPEEARGEVYQLDISPYVGNNDWDGWYDYKIDMGPPSGPYGVSRIVLNGKQQTIARWPNSGFHHFFMEDGSFSLLNTGAANEDGGVIKMKMQDETMKRWGTATDAKFRLCCSWIYRAAEFTGVDLEEEVILGKSAVSEGLSLNQCDGNYRWYIENLLEELDIPGEYFIDTPNKKLYYYPAHELNAETDELEIITGPCRVAVIRLDKAQYMKFMDLKFKGANYLGIGANECKNIVFDGVDFDMIIQQALSLRPYENCTVKNCIITSSGGGVLISPMVLKNGLYDKSITDYEDVGIRVKNNHMWDMCRDTLYTNQAIVASGPGVQVKNNTVHNTMGAIIGYDGIDSECSYNEAFATLQETVDTSVMHTGRNWMRYGSKVEYNFYHDICNSYYKMHMRAWPAGGIYWDDTFAGSVQNHNIIETKATLPTSAGVFTNGGRDHYGTGNIIIGFPYGLNFGDNYSWYAVRDGVENADADVNNLVNQIYTGFVEAYEYSKEKNNFFYQKYNKWLDGLYKDVTEFGVYQAKNIVFDENVFFDVGQPYKVNGTLSEGVIRSGKNNADSVFITNSYEAPEGTSKEDIFVDPAKGDYRVTEKGKEILGIPENTKFELDESFDISKIGSNLEIELEDEFNILYPMQGTVTTDTDKYVTLKWEEAKFADRYDWKIYKKSDNSLVKEDESVFCGAEVYGLEPNTEYYVTVTAKYMSGANYTTWESASGKVEFKTGSFKKEKVLDDITKGTVLMRLDDDRMFVDGNEQKLSHKVIADMYGNSEIRVPFEDLAKLFGATNWSYDATNKTPSFTYEGKKYSNFNPNFCYYFGTYTENGEEKRAYWQNSVEDGVFMTNYRTFAELFGKYVTYDWDKYIVVISDEPFDTHNVDFTPAYELFGIEY